MIKNKNQLKEAMQQRTKLFMSLTAFLFKGQLLTTDISCFMCQHQITAGAYGESASLVLLVND